MRLVVAVQLSVVDIVSQPKLGFDKIIRPELSKLFHAPYSAFVSSFASAHCSDTVLPFSRNSFNRALNR
jgi:hypothetical protein